jgi:tripartite-type tricarboxylate transporter receptor subunit TctC
MMRVLSAAVLSLIACAASAQDWPNRPVTMIVPYAAGGPVDTVGRIMAQALSEVLGQQVIIENIGGAGGMTGATRVVRAAPDGYTFLLGGSATMTTVPALYGKKALYNPLTDFEHVIQFADSARILIARKDFPASSLQEFVAYAKQNTDKLQYGSSGAGAGAHVCALLLDQAMGVTFGNSNADSDAQLMSYPSSLAVLRSGSTSERLSPMVAIGFTVPALICWMAVETCSQI